MLAAMLAVTGGTVADVYSGTWVEANVEVDRGRIVYVGPRRPPADAARIDARGKVVAPGFIEPHTHPWVLYSPTSLLEAAVPDGTTTLVYDNLFFFLAHGPDGLRTIVDAMNEAPAHVRWVARLAPQSAYDDEAERFATAIVAPLLSWPEVVASGEITGWARVARGDERLAAGIAAAKAAGRRVDGHNAGASYDRLAELSAAGISADHEGISGADALNRLRLGMWTMLRQSSLRPDLEAILRDLGDVVNTSRRLMLTTDGATPSFYAERGMIGGALRLAVECGVDPMRALQLATIDPATFLHLDEELGGLAPGRRATMVLLPEAERYTRGAGGDLFRPELVLVDGRVVAQDGRLTASLPEVPWEELRGYPLAPPQTFADPAIYAIGEPVPAMRYESAVINRRADLAGPELPPGHVHAALVGRDGSWVTHAVVAGLLDVSGFATTATTSLELLVLGRDPAAMARAAARVAEMGGGFAFDRGWSAPLEIDGLITSGGFDKAVTFERKLSNEMAAHGYPFHDPLYSLLFASGDFLPELRLTPRGVIEVKSGAVLAPPRPLVRSPR
jgi:adenine deaminase